ncbi:MAG: hypothetical protein HY922_01150 [Elusimicrobia bacterium]|nr:hypothetical protein [Elusimicrobiota bacterium]
MNGTICLDEIRPWVLEKYEQTCRPAMSARGFCGTQEDDLAQMGEPVIPLWDLEIDGRVVRPAVPIAIRLRKDGDLFFAENDSLAVYASGASREEAIEDFRQTAAFFVREFHSLGPDQVMGRGSRLREQFLKVFP